MHPGLVCPAGVQDALHEGGTTPGQVPQHTHLGAGWLAPRRHSECMLCPMARGNAPAKQPARVEGRWRVLVHPSETLLKLSPRLKCGVALHHCEVCLVHGAGIIPCLLKRTDECSFPHKNHHSCRQAAVAAPMWSACPVAGRVACPQRHSPIDAVQQVQGMAPLALHQRGARIGHLLYGQPCPGRAACESLAKLDWPSGVPGCIPHRLAQHASWLRHGDEVPVPGQDGGYCEAPCTPGTRTLHSLHLQAVPRLHFS